jgi:hypothetical protein
VQQFEGPRTQPTTLVAASAGRDALHAALAAADAGVDAEALLQALTDIILREPLWCRLRAAQRLDRLDIEGVLPLYQQLVARGEPIPRPELAGPCLPEQPPPPADDGPPPQLPVDPAEQQEAVRRFLVAMSAKDCSVMIAIRRTSQVCPLHSLFFSHPRTAQRSATPLLPPLPIYEHVHVSGAALRPLVAPHRGWACSHTRLPSTSCLKQAGCGTLLYDIYNTISEICRTSGVACPQLNLVV